MEGEWVVLRGGGDIATGVAQKLFRAGIPVLMLEIERPTAIRRTVALSEAVYEGIFRVEDVRCRRVAGLDALEGCRARGEVPLLVDPEGEAIRALRPGAVIDAILAKRNLGTCRDMAPVTIALGPGFRAGEDVDAVIETMRGHDLGRLILSGGAMPDTGIPGELGGKGAERVLRAPVEGEVRHIRAIGDRVPVGAPLCTVGGEVVAAPFDGLLRGLIREGLCVPAGMKIADIDPRADVGVTTISDKARCLGGAALEAYLLLQRG